jgi:hypothetical protein
MASLTSARTDHSGGLSGGLSGGQTLCVVSVAAYSAVIPARRIAGCRPCRPVPVSRYPARVT